MAIDHHSVRRDQRFGCLIISSPQGHSGKTTITIGISRLLRKGGLAVQPFKKGPDYIDPPWLTLAAGRDCRNLDAFLFSEDGVIRSFERACRGADLALVEGAMGLYDGVDGGTTASLARLLRSPVLLVINCSRMTGSIGAMVTGYQNFEKDVNIAGVILNYVSGPRHERKLREAVEQYGHIPVVGSIPRDQALHIAERHLGLVPSQETPEAESWIDRIGRALESHLDLDKILGIARRAEPPQVSPLPKGLPAEASAQAGAREGIDESRHSDFGRGRIYASPTENPFSGETAKETIDRRKVRIGVLRDRVFSFYYPENLEALTRESADLIFIDSLRDRLPEIDGLYIGGGFPEFFLRELEGNSELRRDIARAIDNHLPVYAECAGLMYLCRTIHWKGRSAEMVGAIAEDVTLLDRPQGHGYVEAAVVRENPFFPIGMTLRGHEFHHSRLRLSEPLTFAYHLSRGQGIQEGEDGIVYKNMFASYTHLHALGCPEWAKAFVALAARVKQAAVRWEGRQSRIVRH